MIDQWRLNETKPFLPQAQFFGMPPLEARRWVHTRFFKLSPIQNMRVTAQQRPTPEMQHQQTAVPTKIPTTQMNKAGLLVYHLDALTIQALLEQASSITGGAKQGTTQEREKDEGGTYFKVSEGEKIHMKKIFGLKESAGDDHFQKWYIDLFAKHQNEKDKYQVIATAIKKYDIFDDSKVPICPTLVKTIIKRDGKASEIGKRAALVNSEQLLSPFAVVCLT